MPLSGVGPLSSPVVTSDVASEVAPSPASSPKVGPCSLLSVDVAQAPTRRTPTRQAARPSETRARAELNPE